MQLQGFFGPLKEPKQKGPQQLSCPCGLDKECLGPFMPVGGFGKKGILVLAEAPGREEDEAYTILLEKRGKSSEVLGQQLIGAAGKRLERELIQHDIDLHEDCWKLNSVNCRPSKNRTPTGAEIAACRPRVRKAIKDLQPGAIFAFGMAAIESLYGDRFYDDGGLGAFGRWRGWAIPDQELGCWVFPAFHPSYILRSERSNRGPSSPEIPLYFGIDIRKMAENYDQPFPIYKPKTRLLSEAAAINFIKKLFRTEHPVVFDYETTGLKPHARGHEIVYCSARIVKEGTPAYAWEMTDPITAVWKKFLRSKTRKIAHNIKFEEMWNRAIFGLETVGWYWDTMLTAHELDNRGGISSLKMQTLLNFGVTDYSSSITPYLKSPTSLGSNKILQAPKDSVLEYCAMDSWFPAELYLIQRTVMGSNPQLEEGRELFLNGAVALMDDEENGLVLDKEYVKKEIIHLQRQIDWTRKKILESEEGKLWTSIYPEPNYNSGQQLARILFEELDHTPIKKTKSGKASVDVEALEDLRHIPLVEKILRIRKLDKIKGTYLEGWLSECGEDHLLRAFYHLHIARTFRSSASNPNYQNVPKRDKEAKKATRRGLRPRPGHILVEVDYSQVEVRAGCPYHKDPVMINYIKTSPGGMHIDMAQEIFILEPEEVSNDAKQGTKNQYVFPSFYGSYWANTGKGLWKWSEDCKTAQGLPLRKHLKSHGLGSEEKFIQHIKKVEDRFWGDRFRVYAKWKEDFYKEYLKKGHFDTLTGFRCQGPMRKNEVVNYPIQGCLQGRSRVWTNKGLIPIKELIGIPSIVWTGFNWANGIGIDMGPSQLAEIELSSGLTIHCDIRHKLKNELHEWVDFEDIKIGNYVALPMQPKTILPSKKMNWDFVFGFILGDGDISHAERKYIRIHGGKTKENDLLRIHNFLRQNGYSKNYGGSHLTLNDKNGKSRLWIQNKEFAKHMEHAGFIFGSTAHTKELPSYVWTVDGQQKRDFLCGLWRSDGARGKWQKGNLHMCNKRLLEQLQIFSIVLGYDTALISTKNGWLLRFNQRGFNKKAHRKVPLQTVKKLIGNIGFKNYSVRNEYIVDKRVFDGVDNITQYVAERIIEKNGPPNSEIYRYDTVKEIRYLNQIENTYTMSVDNYLHQFIADGVVTKNSAFHYLLMSKILTRQWIREMDYTNRILPSGQIHDSGLFSLDPELLPEFAEALQFIWCEQLRAVYDFINVPLEIEIEVTPVNGSWYEKKEYKP